MTKDLVVLVADGQQKKTIETLLDKRRQSLGIREVTYDVFPHPRRDRGVFRGAPSFLAPLRPPTYLHSLVILDREWDGAPRDASHLRNDLLRRFEAKGWQADECEIVVIRVADSGRGAAHYVGGDSF